MIPFDSSEISNWADKPDADHLLPDLIRRLILATVSMPSLLDMPRGSSVWLPGWDGLLVTEEGNAWVPEGASAWEFSREKAPGKKATADYTKRTKNPQGVDSSKATFMSVTPRKWVGKRKWATERGKEGQWSDVRALNADDLVAWLGQAPAVAHWFARLIGKLPATGVVPLDEWRENWSTATNPWISPELVAAGRQDKAERIAQWFQGAASYYYVQGDTREEAIAFLAASAHCKSPQWGTALLTRAVVVQTADAWRGLEGHPSPLVLVRDFSNGAVSSQVAVSRGHHVLTPLSGHQDPSGSGVTLPRLGRDETVSTLTAMGLSAARARLLARNTARRLPIIRRQLIDEAGGPTPDWASPPTPHSIVALVLIGQWEENNEGDRAIVAEVAGQSYETVESDITTLTAVADSPLVKVGNRWRFVSHEEAWHLLAPRLTSSDVKRFERIAAELLAAVSPEFELPVEERYMAGALGKLPPHSGTLREGIVRSLALMGTHSGRAKNAEDVAYVPARVVSSALAGGKGWQTWATLCDSLAVLAEASPEALLDSTERDLATFPGPFQNLFAQEGDGFFGGTPHTGLLWALECLAWSQDHFARVARILAHLAEIDPGGQVSNRPIESLKSLFLPWIRFSEASDEHRLEALKMLLSDVPRAGWQLLVGAYPSSHGHVTLRQPPSWRPWGQDGAPAPTAGEYHRFVRELERLLHEEVGTDAARWADLLGIISSLSTDARQRAIGLLSQQTDTLRQHPALDNLWTKLRKQLHHHNSYPNADWAMDRADRKALESVYQELTPSGPVAAYAWMFDNWPDLPGGETHEYVEATERIANARLAAVRAAYESGGPPAILGIAKAAEEPHQVGVAIALNVNTKLVLDLVLEHLGSTDLKLRSMAHGALRALFNQSGWQLLEEAIGRIKACGAMPQSLADVYLAAPALRETWQRLDSESQEVQTAYWKSLWWPNARAWDSEDMAFAVRHLLSVHRSREALNWLALEPMSYEVVVQLLEAIPADTAADERLPVDDFRIAHLFKRLDQSDDVPDSAIARLEIPYVEILEHHRPHLALHREVTRQPSLFADLIAWAFRHSDGQAEAIDDEQMRKNRAVLGYNILWRLRTFPGLKEDSSVDAESLSTWVNEVRRLCKERARENIGDQQIGQILANAPVGRDGIWPCEPVRDLIDSLASRHVGIGFVIGKSNLRGVTSRTLFEGGRQERSLADRCLDDAAKIAAKWPLTAQLLRELAAGYKSEASREDQEADWTDQFEA